MNESQLLSRREESGMETDQYIISLYGSIDRSSSDVLDRDYARLDFITRPIAFSEG